MRRNLFSNLFSSKKKQKQSDEDEDIIRPPDRRMSISKSGRMKEAKTNRHSTLTDGVFPPKQSEKVNVKTSDLHAQVANTQNEPRKSILEEDEELNIDDIIKELEQTAL